MPARVLVVDDHPLTREALAALLRAHGFELAGIASDGEEAIATAAQTQPDLVLLDLLMPGLDGLSALPRLREAAPDCEVVVLTASGTEENLLAAIRGGAAGYLLKTESPERIAEFLEGVVHGDAALSGPVARRLLDQVRSGGRGSGVPDRIAGRTRSPSGSSSRSTRSARTSRASCASSACRRGARRSSSSRSLGAKT
jgi:DNA-binding NarL/FixJ family response regulator